MRTGGLFRRNTTNVASKREEDFADYAIVISSEEDPKKLKEYITKLYKAFKDKSKSLRSAYAKLDLLNNEVVQEKTRFNDIDDENKSLRDQMQGMADQLVSKEEEFRDWQAKLAEQTQREREVLTEEFNDERERFLERITQLEDALSLANLEITRLTIEISDKKNSERRLSTSTANDSRSSLELLFTDKSKKSEDDKHELTKQILEITQRRMSLQTELSLLEEENEDLKVNRVLSIRDHIRSLYVGTFFHFSLTFDAFHFSAWELKKDSIQTNHEGESITTKGKRRTQAASRQTDVYEIIGGCQLERLKEVNECKNNSYEKESRKVYQSIITH